MDENFILKCMILLLGTLLASFVGTISAVLLFATFLQ